MDDVEEAVRRGDLGVDRDHDRREGPPHDELVAAWNGREGPWDARTFLEWAVPRACQAMEVSAGSILADGTRDQRAYDAMLESKVVPPPKVQLGGPALRPFADLPPTPRGAATKAPGRE